jgi:hypothetical protein
MTAEKKNCRHCVATGDQVERGLASEGSRRLGALDHNQIIVLALEARG